MTRFYNGHGVTIVDATADLPTSPIEGMIVYQKDTNELKIYDGASWITMLDTDAAPALQLIATNTFSAAASTSFENKFSSAFTNYRLVMNAMCSGAAVNMQFRFLNASNVEQTTYYYSSGLNSSAQTGTVTAYTASNTNVGYLGSCGTYYAGFAYDILNPYLTGTGLDTFITGSAMCNNSTGTLFTSLGVVRGAGGLQEFGIKLYPSAGTMTGTARLYGYRDAL